MNTAKVLILALVAITVGMAGCVRPYGMGSGYREAALERGIAEMNELVSQTVKDPEKAKQIQAIFTGVITEAQQSLKQSREYHQKLFALNASYDATPEQFGKILDDLNNARMASAAKILGMRFKIKSMLTAQEWKELTDEMNKARSRYAAQPKAEGM